MSAWPMVRLGEVCEVVMGQAPKGIYVNEDSIGTPLIAGAGDFSKTSLNISKWTSKPTKISKKSDLILSIRATIGTYRIADQEYCLGRGVAALRAKCGLNQEFLAFAIDFRKQNLLSKARGATFLQVSKKDIQDLTIPLPPLGEQKRIAEMLSEVNKIIICTNSQRETVDQLERRLFQEFRNQNSKSSQRVGDKCQVHTGATPSRNNPAYYNGSIPWIKTGEVQGTIIDNAEEYITETAIQETNCRKFPAGTILVAMYGQGATRGRAGILNCGAATNQACAAIIPHLPEDKDYTFAVLHNSYNKLRSLGRGGTQPNLNLTLIKNFEIPWPTKSTRENFMQRWRQLNILRLLLTQRSALLQELQRSLSARAFAGEL